MLHLTSKQGAIDKIAKLILASLSTKDKVILTIESTKGLLLPPEHTHI